MGNNPIKFIGDDSLPVENVSWEDSPKILKKLSEKEGKTYRLPTEAECEYTSQAGSTSEYCFWDDESKLVECA